MADEVIIEEYSAFDAGTQAPTVPHKTQVIDAGDKSAALSNTTKIIGITAREVSFWYKLGASDVSAAAETDNNLFIPVGTTRYHNVSKSSGLYIDTAQDV